METIVFVTLLSWSTWLIWKQVRIFICPQDYCLLPTKRVLCSYAIVYKPLEVIQSTVWGNLKHDYKCIVLRLLPIAFVNDAYNRVLTIDLETSRMESS